MGDPEPPRGMNPTPVVIAIIVGALIVAGTIFVVTRPPSECEQWNKEALTAARRVNAILEAPPGTVSQTERETLVADLRNTVASAPTEDEDCELSEEVEEELRQFPIP